jgi:hypothetical protein
VRPLDTPNVGTMGIPVRWRVGERPPKKDKMKKLTIIALALSIAGPALAQTNMGGGNGTTGSTATGLTATGSGSGMNNGGTGMNNDRTGMHNGTGMNNNGTRMNNNGTAMKGSNRMNGPGSSQE